MGSHYVHGSAPEERARLGLMNAILNAACLRELALEGGERVLDIGCGPARFAQALTSAHSGVSVLGVERDAAQREAAREFAHERVEVRAGDACDLPLASAEWGTFDVAWARFVLEHVDDPLRVVEQMVRAVKPGGRVVLCDDDHELLRLDPPAPRLMRVWEAYQATYRAHGNDPWVGRRLPRLLHDAGARPVRATWVFFGSCAGAPDWSLVNANCRGILSGAREQIERHLAPGEFEAGLGEYDVWVARRDASYWLPLAWAEGRRA